MWPDTPWMKIQELKDPLQELTARTCLYRPGWCNKWKQNQNCAVITPRCSKYSNPTYTYPIPYISKSYFKALLLYIKMTIHLIMHHKSNFTVQKWIWFDLENSTKLNLSTTVHLWMCTYLIKLLYSNCILYLMY